MHIIVIGKILKLSMGSTLGKNFLQIKSNMTLVNVTVLDHSIYGHIRWPNSFLYIRSNSLNIEDTKVCCSYVSNYIKRKTV